MGSEMCIRDSYYTPFVESFVKNKTHKVVRRGPQIISMLPDDVLCLLYTSDAADDLLCVDLGGRRIIKKKTSTHRI